MIKLLLGIFVYLGFGYLYAQERVAPLIPEGQYVESRSLPKDRPTITYSVGCIPTACSYHIVSMFNDQKISMPTSIKPLDLDVIEKINESIKHSFESVNDPRSNLLSSELETRPVVDRCFRVGFFTRDFGYFCTSKEKFGQMLLFFSQTKREGACWNDICFNGKLVRIKNE